MKNKGFTLTEVLATLVVLGILMLIAIPNISGMMKKQRVNQLISDSTNMIETAKIKVSKDRYLKKPNVGECIIYPLDYLNDNGNIEKGPNGGSYDQFESFVVYTRIGNRYEYYVRLIENYNDKKYGIEYKDINTIKDLGMNGIEEIETNLGLTMDDTNSTAIAKLNGKISMCSSIKQYYLNKLYCVERNGKYYDDIGREVTQAEFEVSCPNV